MKPIIEQLIVLIHLNLHSSASLFSLPCSRA